jgi:hypothetical protein
MISVYPQYWRTRTHFPLSKRNTREKYHDKPDEMPKFPSFEILTINERKITMQGFL